MPLTENLTIYWSTRPSPKAQIKGALYCLLVAALLYWHPNILQPIDSLFAPLEWTPMFIRLFLIGAALCAFLCLFRIVDKTSAIEIGDKGLVIRFAKLWGGRNIFVPWEQIHSCESLHSARQFFRTIRLNMYDEKPEHYGFSSSQVSRHGSGILPPPSGAAVSAFITLYFFDKSTKELVNKINECLEQSRTKSTHAQSMN